MWKRALGALLWFAAAWLAYEVVWSVTGVPRQIGPVVAFVVAAMVTVDPVGSVWRIETELESVTGSAEVDQTLA